MDIEQQANYYAVIPAPVRYNKKLKYPERLLYGEITALSNRYGYCFASNKYFASLYDVVPETVSRWISHLKECGYINVNIIKNENNQIIERRIYIIDKINNTYCLNNQYPSCVKNQESIDEKVKDNNINNNNSINQSYQSIDKIDVMDETAAYMELIRENIDYDIVMQDYEWKHRDMYEELYQIICDVVCVPRQEIRIAGEDYPYRLVKSRFLKLKKSHLEYVIGCMERNTTKIANIKAYLITALYNAPNTICHYDSAEVNYDISI